MKKIYFIFALGLLLVSCKNESKSTETSSETTKEGNITATRTVGDLNTTTFSGMFLYLESDNAAVLQTAGSKIYSIAINDEMKALNEQCKQYKVKDHDMVPVVIRGVKKPNPVKNAWKEVIEVTEILSVQKPSGQDGTIIINSNQ